jgi:formamidopyrimidine-DNA glycosylase
MPELPEVETIARGVNKRVRGDRIVEAWFSRHPQPFKTPAARQARGLEGRAILAVHRTGKHIVCELGTADGIVHSHRSEVSQKFSEEQQQILRLTTPNLHPTNEDLFVGTPERLKSTPGAPFPTPATKTCRRGSRFAQDDSGLCAAYFRLPSAQWIVHLGMTGRLLVTTPDAPVAIHTHARLSLMSGRELRFVDPRRFGRLEYRDLSHAESFCAAGADPLTVTAEEFAQLFSGRKLAIKAALLNQKLLSGVGNIYADESLFRAGIRPRRQSGRLTRAEVEKLRLALGEVLKQAIRLGGSSVSDYVDADGERGFFQLEHNVYQRTGVPCRLCQTPIRRIVVAGRGTHYCPRCQR